MDERALPRRRHSLSNRPRRWSYAAMATAVHSMTGGRCCSGEVSTAQMTLPNAGPASWRQRPTVGHDMSRTLSLHRLPRQWPGQLRLRHRPLMTRALRSVRVGTRTPSLRPSSEARVAAVGATIGLTRRTGSTRFAYTYARVGPSSCSASPGQKDDPCLGLFCKQRDIHMVYKVTDDIISYEDT